MRLVEAAADPASSLGVDRDAVGRVGHYGAVVVDRRIDVDGYDNLQRFVGAGGRLIYKGDHGGGNALLDWAAANGWSATGEEFGDKLCGVVAQKPTAAKAAEESL